MSNLSVEENSSDGTVVGTLSATDPDSGETFTYDLLNNAGGRFAIQGDQLVVGNGTLLDFETDTSHLVRVEVTDSAGNTFEKDFTIGVDDVDEGGGGGGGTATHVGTENPDTIVGTSGDDTILGLGGNDILTGGSGRDTFIFGDNDGWRDTITDFTDGEDQIAFTDIDNVSGMSDLTISRNNTNRVTVRYVDDEGNSNQIIVQSGSNISLTESDFDFDFSLASSAVAVDAPGSHGEDCSCAACGHNHDNHDHGKIDRDVIARIIEEFGGDLPGKGYDWKSLIEWHAHADHDHGLPPPSREHVDLDQLDVENEFALPFVDDPDLIA